MTVSNARHRWWQALAVILIGGLLIAACGSDDADETPADSGAAGQQVAPTDTAAPDYGSSAVTEATETEQPASDPTIDPDDADPADPAPALGSIDSWHNSEPLTLDQLRGSPVLLVFWADF